MEEPRELMAKSYGDAIDLLKVGADITKHLATLSTASIVLAATFQDKFQKAHCMPWAPALAIVLMAVSLVANVGGLTHLMQSISSLNALRDNVRAGTQARPHHPAKMHDGVRNFNRMFGICAWSFILGILTLGTFAIANSF